jgi:catechol 2,3-dioxygenase-like lactoylglutathione lyase family enzyme
MKSPLIQGIRSVALTVPDLDLAAAFYTNVWRLDVAVRAARALYLRGSGADHHLLALHEAPGTPRIRQIELRARSADALGQIADATDRAGGCVEQSTCVSADPAGGQRLVIRDPQGRRYAIRPINPNVSRTPC